jgi:phage baseplate assembly protein W
VAMLEEDADVASSLEILLSTTPGERVMQPLYGCNLSELLFESLDARLKTLMIDKVESSILYFEPRITLESVNLDDSGQLEGVVLIEVVYTVKTTNSRFNFVYPYYKQEGTDINLTTTVSLLPSND